MTDLHIYIPSKARADIQRTFTRLPQNWRANTTIVVPPEDFDAYKRRYESVVATPDHVRGIASTRDWILEYAHAAGQRYIVMLDDDVVLQKRRGSVIEGEKPPSITNCTTGEYEEAFQWIIETLTSGYAHCGWGLRFNGFAMKGDVVSPGRMMHCLAYDLEVVMKEGVRFCTGADPKVHSMDDFNMTLQLLTRGYPNVVSLVWRASPAPSNARGGASTWRTLETQNASAHRMKELFPDFVNLREKKNWQGMEGATMYDITARWKKALAYGLVAKLQKMGAPITISGDFDDHDEHTYLPDESGEG